MPKFELQPGETLIVNDPWTKWMRREMQPVEGQLKLTNKRLVFIQKAHPLALFVLFIPKSVREHVEMEFPLEEIKNVSKEEVGEKKRLVIENGIERPKIFVTSKVETFLGELKKLLRN